MASYTRQRILTKVVVARGGRLIKEILYESGGLITVVHDHAEEAAIAGKKAAIWLLDGPPRCTIDDAPYVAFASPYEDWIKVTVKKHKCTRVFMPTRTLEELYEAAASLNRLDLLATTTADEAKALGGDLDDLVDSASTPTVLGYRYGIFGGVPRMCFKRDSNELRVAVQALAQAIEATETKTMVSAVERTTLDDTKEHGLVHYVPLNHTRSGRPTRFRFAKNKVASTAIERFLLKRQYNLRGHNQTEFLTVGRFVPEMKTAQAYALETCAFRLLENGCSIDARKDGTGGLIRLDLPKPLRQVSSAFELFVLNQPHLMTLHLEAIAGVYWLPQLESAPGIALLFHSTVSKNRAENAGELCSVLKGLGLWEQVDKSPETVAALVLVVPPWKRYEMSSIVVTPKPPPPRDQVAVKDNDERVLARIPQYTWVILDD